MQNYPACKEFIVAFFEEMSDHCVVVFQVNIAKTEWFATFIYMAAVDIR